MTDAMETIPETRPVVATSSKPRGRPPKAIPAPAVESPPEPELSSSEMVVKRVEDGRYRVTVLPGNVRRQIEGKGQNEKWVFVADVCENGANAVIRPGIHRFLRLVSVLKSREPDGTEVTRIKPLVEVEL